jgi:hypothetical protein
MCSFAVGAGFPHDVCFASGVRVTFDSMALDGLGCGNSFRARVTRPDGSLCYVFDRYHDETKTCADFRYTWYDAEGRIVASATKSAGDNPDLTVFCRLSHYGLTSNCDIGSSDPSCCDIDSAGAASCGADLPYGRCTEDGCP